MKKITLLLFVGLISLSTNSQEFKFEKEIINYGKIALGSDGNRVFEFTNVGDQPLIIERIKPACGCTLAKKPEKPIMPGENGIIEVGYDTKRPGGFTKGITIFSNAKNKRKVIKIKGYISKEILPEKEKSMLSNS